MRRTGTGTAIAAIVALILLAAAVLTAVQVRGAIGAGTVVSVTRVDNGGLHSYRASATLARAGRTPGPVHTATLSLLRDGATMVSTTIVLRRGDRLASGSASSGCTPHRRGPRHTWRAKLAVRRGATIYSRPATSRCS